MSKGYFIQRHSIQKLLHLQFLVFQFLHNKPYDEFFKCFRSCFQFSGVLIAVVVLEISGSITAFVYQDDIKQDITNEMNSTLPDYKPNDMDSQVSVEWDTLQEKV